MKRFTVITYESRYYKYYIDAADKEEAIDNFNPQEGGKEFDYDWYVVDIEELEDFTEFVLDAATHPLQDEAHDK